MFRKQPYIGIDISDHSIEVLAANKRREVLAYGRIFLEEGIVEDGEIIKKDALAKRLRDALSNTSPRSLGNRSKIQAVIGLPESKVFVRYFEFPSAVEDELILEQIRNEISTIVPFDPQKMYADFLSTQIKERKTVLYASIPKELMKEYGQVLRLARIQPIAFDLEALSLKRALIPYDSPSTMIIDIGTRITNAHIFGRNGILRLSVIIPAAGNRFTGELSKILRIDWDTAERHKKTFGITEKTLFVLQAGFQLIINESKKAIHHYETVSGEKVQKIILAGGSALLPKIEEYFAANLSQKVEIGDPLKLIKNKEVFSKKISPLLFATALGLALRSTDSFSINLLPGTRKKFRIADALSGIKRWARKNPKKFLSAASAFAGVIILGIVLYTYAVKKSAEITPQAEPLEAPIPQEVAPLEKTEETAATSTEEAPEEAEPEPEIVRVTITATPTGWLNVREGPGTNFPQILRVNSGESYSLLEESSGWYKIDLGEEKNGWIYGIYAIKQQ